MTRQFRPAPRLSVARSSHIPRCRRGRACLDRRYRVDDAESRALRRAVVELDRMHGPPFRRRLRSRVASLNRESHDGLRSPGCCSCSSPSLLHGKRDPQVEPVAATAVAAAGSPFGQRSASFTLGSLAGPIRHPRSAAAQSCDGGVIGFGRAAERAPEPRRARARDDGEHEAARPRIRCSFPEIRFTMAIACRSAPWPAASGGPRGCRWRWGRSTCLRGREWAVAHTLCPYGMATKRTSPDRLFAPITSLRFATAPASCVIPAPHGRIPTSRTWQVSARKRLARAHAFPTTTDKLDAAFRVHRCHVTLTRSQQALC